MSGPSHIATQKQFAHSLSQMLREYPLQTALRMLAEDIASAHLEHGLGKPLNSIEYLVKNGMLTTPMGQLLRDLYDPPLHKRTEDYEANKMLAHNQENYRIAERLLISGEAKEVIIPSLAKDYGSDHSVLYVFRREGDQVVCVCINAPKEAEDLRIFTKNLFGVDLKAGGTSPNDSYFHTSGNTVETPLSLNDIMRAARDTFGDRFSLNPDAQRLIDSYYSESAARDGNEQLGKGMDSMFRQEVEKEIKRLEAILLKMGVDLNQINPKLFSDPDFLNSVSAELRGYAGQKLELIRIGKPSTDFHERYRPEHAEALRRWSEIHLNSTSFAQQQARAVSELPLPSPFRPAMNVSLPVGRENSPPPFITAQQELPAKSIGIPEIQKVAPSTSFLAPPASQLPPAHSTERPRESTRNADLPQVTIPSTLAADRSFQEDTIFRLFKIQELAQSAVQEVRRLGEEIKRDDVKKPAAEELSTRKTPSVEPTSAASIERHGRLLSDASMPHQMAPKIEATSINPQPSPPSWDISRPNPQEKFAVTHSSEAQKRSEARSENAAASYPGTFAKQKQEVKWPSNSSSSRRDSSPFKSRQGAKRIKTAENTHSRVLHHDTARLATKRPSAGTHVTSDRRQGVKSLQADRAAKTAPVQVQISRRTTSFTRIAEQAAAKISKSRVLLRAKAMLRRPVPQQVAHKTSPISSKQTKPRSAAKAYTHRALRAKIAALQRTLAKRKLLLGQRKAAAGRRITKAARRISAQRRQARVQRAKLAQLAKRAQKALNKLHASQRKALQQKKKSSVASTTKTPSTAHKSGATLSKMQELRRALTQLRRLLVRAQRVKVPLHHQIQMKERKKTLGLTTTLQHAAQRCRQFFSRLGSRSLSFLGLASRARPLRHEPFLLLRQLRRSVILLRHLDPRLPPRQRRILRRLTQQMIQELLLFLLLLSMAENETILAADGPAGFRHGNTKRNFLRAMDGRAAKELRRLIHEFGAFKRGVKSRDHTAAKKQIKGSAYYDAIERRYPRSH